MKKTFLFCCIGLFTLPVFSQSGFGLKAGLNFSNLKFSNRSYTTSPVAGVHAGVFYKIAINEKAGIQPEICYSSEGNTWKTNNTPGKISESLVRVPILFQYNIAGGFYAEAGPQYSLLVSIKQSRNGGEAEDIKEFYKTGTPGYALGAGYRFSGNVAGLRAGIRFNGDFSKINKNVVGGNDLKNNLWQLTLTYSLSKN
jgi:predicted porin